MSQLCDKILIYSVAAFDFFLQARSTDVNRPFQPRETPRSLSSLLLAFQVSAIGVTFIFLVSISIVTDNMQKFPFSKVHYKHSFFSFWDILCCYLLLPIHDKTYTRLFLILPYFFRVRFYPEFWIQLAKLSHTVDSASENVPYSGIRITLHGATELQIFEGENAK